MPDTLSDAFAAAVLLSSTDKPDTLPPGRLSPVSPLPHSSSYSKHHHPTPSSSSGSSGSVSRAPLASSSGLASRRSHSGEIPLPSDAPQRGAARPGHRRSGSGPLIFTSGAACSSSATSPLTNALPAGNICPSGRIAKPLAPSCSSAATPPPPPPPRASRHDVLGSGTANYGHGSIVRSRAAVGATDDDAVLRRAMSAADPEEVKRAGNEQYRKGCFEEALRLYDRALALCPDNAACRGNRAAALIGLRRLGEAVKECEEALRIDPSYGRAHHRLASLHIR